MLSDVCNEPVWIGLQGRFTALHWAGQHAIKAGCTCWKVWMNEGVWTDRDNMTSRGVHRRNADIPLSRAHFESISLRSEVHSCIIVVKHTFLTIPRAKIWRFETLASLARTRRPKISKWNKTLIVKVLGSAFANCPPESLRERERKTFFCRCGNNTKRKRFQSLLLPRSPSAANSAWSFSLAWFSIAFLSIS